MPAKFKTAGPACPCEAGCEIFNDDASTNRLSTDYSTRAGTWGHASGKYTCTTALGLIVENTALSSTATGVVASAKVKPATNSDIARVIILYVDDDNLWYAEGQPGASNGTLKLFERTGGTTTQRGSTTNIGTWTANTEKTLCASSGSGVISASVDGVGLAFTYSAAARSTKCGLGTGSGSSSVSFRDFLVTKHYVDDHDCPGPCSGTGPGPPYDGFFTGNCSNCTSPYPDFIIATLAGMADGTHPTLGNCTTCSDYDGTYILPYVGKDLASGECYYQAFFKPGHCTHAVFGGTLGASYLVRVSFGQSLGSPYCLFYLEESSTFGGGSNMNVSVGSGDGSSFPCMTPQAFGPATFGGNFRCSGTVTVSAVGF